MASFNILRLENGNNKQYDIVPRSEIFRKISYKTNLTTTAITLVDNAQLFSNYPNRKVYALETDDTFLNLPYVVLNLICQVKFNDNTTVDLNVALQADRMMYSDRTTYNGYRNVLFKAAFLIDAIVYVTIEQDSAALNIKIESALSSSTELSDFTVKSLDSIYLPNVDLSVPNIEPEPSTV